jgi:hypothetical protein
MDGSSSAAAVTFVVWGLPSLYLQAPPDHFCGHEPCPVRRTRCGEGWRDLSDGPRVGMLQTLAAQRPTLFSRVPTPLWARRTPSDTQGQRPAADLRCRSLKLTMKLLRRCDLPCTSRLMILYIQTSWTHAPTQPAKGRRCRPQDFPAQKFV